MAEMKMTMACFLAIAALAVPCKAQWSLPSGMTYVWWKFDQAEFEDLQVDFSIEKDLPEKPGIYLQFYQGKIGDVGFYFGLQTDVYQPKKGGQGKGILFSRWGTRDLKNVRAVSNGWVQSSGHEGDFVGIRYPYPWTNHRYRFRLTKVDEDKEGVWYGVFILDYDTGTEDYAGAMRFPKQAKIKDGGGSWTEVYSHAKSVADLPYGHIILSGAYANSRTLRAQRASSVYAKKIPNSDIYFDPKTQEIHMLFGKGVTRKHPKGRLF